MAWGAVRGHVVRGREGERRVLAGQTAPRRDGCHLTALRCPSIEIEAKCVKNRPFKKCKFEGKTYLVAVVEVRMGFEM